MGGRGPRILGLTEAPNLPRLSWTAVQADASAAEEPSHEAANRRAAALDHECRAGRSRGTFLAARAAGPRVGDAGGSCDATDRPLLRRGLRLEYATLSWNVVGTVVLMIAAAATGSVAFAGFGVDTGRRLANPVFQTEAQVTVIDGALAAAVLLGVELNAAVGWVTTGQG